MEPNFFKTPAVFRAWLSKNHERQSELLVGFYKVGSGKPSITWPQSVDQALCFGWIDGVRRRIDDESYTIRFTPRKRTSNWSAINIRRIAELESEGLMTPAGRRAFEARREDRSAIYSYENMPKELPAQDEERFRSNAAAWTWFRAQAPSYQRVAIYWVMGAKREATRERRLAMLIDDSANQRRLAAYTLTPAKKKAGSK